QVRDAAGAGEVLVADRVVPGGVLDLHRRELRPDRVTEDGVEVLRRLPAVVVAAELERLEVDREDEHLVVVDGERLAVLVRDVDGAGRRPGAGPRDSRGRAGRGRGGLECATEGGQAADQGGVPDETAPGQPGGLVLRSVLNVRHGEPF